MAYCNLDKVIYPGNGKYDIPEIEPFNGSLDHIEQWIGFNYVKTEKYCKKKYGVHFCLDDYQFETIWNHSNKYVQNFRNCGAICSPDFSLYLDFPKAIQIYNHYRKHWLARYYQERGITVIPTIAWSDEESLNWCFDGEPKHSIVATSCTGTLNDENAFKAFETGYKEMLRRLEPTKILLFTVAKNIDKIKLDGNVEIFNVSTFSNKPTEV